MAATRQQITSGAQSASGNSASFAVKTISMAAVVVDVTAISGTLDVWLQGSADGGTTWADITADQQLKTNSGASNVSANTNYRNIVVGETTVSRFWMLYKHLPLQYIRLKWILAGTSASATFTAYYEGK